MSRSPEIELAAAQEQMVKVENLSKHFPIREGILQRKVAEVRAVDDVSFSIPEGETLGIVGESGSGKTTLGKTMLRLHEPTEGRVEIGGTDVQSLSSSELKSFRRNAQLVYQDPSSSLNPRMRIIDIIRTPMKIHGIGTEVERLQRAKELIEEVGLPVDYLYKYPSALSGGQKQRVGIARAIAVNPDFIVLDEPTSALDVSIQAKILSLFKHLQAKYDLTYLFISHDLSVIKTISDWVGVMYLGRIVEFGRVGSVFDNPHHPYTRSLLSAIPTITPEDERLKPPSLSLEGDIPDPREKPSGCALCARCPKEFDVCASSEPELESVDDDHFARCYLHEPEHHPEGPEWEET